MEKFEIPYYEVPRDEEDPLFVKSFELGEVEASRDFFNEFGFVVYRDVLPAEQCEASVRELFRLAGYDPARPGTWGGWPKSGLEKYAMPTRSPLFEPVFLQNRQHPNILRAFGNLLQRTDLLVNHDRACLFRPTKAVPFEDRARDMPHWRTNHNLHLDMNPWKYSDPTFPVDAALEALDYRTHHFIFENNQVNVGTGVLPLQATLNFLDNYEEDGGFIAVPGFHHHFDRWVATTRRPDAAAKSLEDDGNGYRFEDRDPMHRRSIRVTMRQGSIVIWHQCLPHGSTFNQSSRFRAAQFLRMFPNDLTPNRALARTRALWKIIREKNFEAQITETGRVVFGL